MVVVRIWDLLLATVLVTAGVICTGEAAEFKNLSDTDANSTANQENKFHNKIVTSSATSAPSIAPSTTDGSNHLLVTTTPNAEPADLGHSATVGNTTNAEEGAGDSDATAINGTINGHPVNMSDGLPNNVTGDDLQNRCGILIYSSVVSMYKEMDTK